MRPGDRRESLDHQVQANIPSKTQPKSEQSQYFRISIKVSFLATYRRNIFAVFLVASLAAVEIMFDEKILQNSVIETCKTFSVGVTS